MADDYRFEDAAREEAERAHKSYSGDPGPLATQMRIRRDVFVEGAVWARDHLAAQEPSEAEVEAARCDVSEAIDQSVRLLVLATDVTFDEFQERFPETRDSLAETAARAALRAAARVRQEADG